MDAASLADPTVLAVGDPRRPIIGRAIFATLVLAVVFTTFAFSVKEIRSISEHSPWQNDPYDVVVSFAIFLVPLVAALLLLRLPLLRRHEPLPVQRVADVLRGSRLILTMVLLVLAADWTSVLLRAEQASWNGATALAVGLLGGTSVVALATALDVRRASGQSLPALRTGRPSPDWLSDALTLATRMAPLLGPGEENAFQAIGWLERSVAGPIRRRPVAAAGFVSLAFGVAIAASAAAEEGPGPELLLFLGVAACGMFAFLGVGGTYLGLVKRAGPLVGWKRRVIDATLVACVSVPLALAFRDWLWWIVGSTASLARLPQLATLLSIVGVSAFVAVFAVESVARSHRS